MDQSNSQVGNYRAVVIGASGATGRELIKELCSSGKWSQVALLVRNTLPQWDQLVGKEKLQIIKVDSLDELEQTEKWQNSFQGYNSIFNCLGCPMSNGDAQFVKVDYTYGIWAAKVALLNKIQTYTLVTSLMADKSSMFLYLRTKGQFEHDVSQMGFKYTIIARPGGIMNREGVRLSEKIASYIPFWPKIQCAELARSIRIATELALSQQPTEEPQTLMYKNDQLLRLLVDQ